MKSIKPFEKFLVTENTTETPPKDEMTAGPNLKKLLYFLNGKTFKFGDLVFKVQPHWMGQKVLGYTHYEIPGKRTHQSIINLVPIEDIGGRQLTDEEIKNKGRYYLCIYRKGDQWIIHLMNWDKNNYIEVLNDKYPKIWNKLNQLCNQYKLQDDEKKPSNRKIDFE